jgi:hypothetical protein
LWNTATKHQAFCFLVIRDELRHGIRRSELAEKAYGD